MYNMKIFALSVIKNEADVIRQNLIAASEWADKIFVYDNGSTDETWKIVCEMANDKIVPWKQDAKTFYEGLRGEVYREFQHLATEGDWWCFRLDADEFYIDNPREFLPTISSLHHVVATNTFQFNLTYEDIAEYEFEKIAGSDIGKLKYYQRETWSEMRFFRHRKRLQWEEHASMPHLAGVLSPRRIRLKHFQYRSLEQIHARIQTRLQARNEGFVGWDHAAESEINHYLSHREELFKDHGDGKWLNDGSINQYKQRTYAYLMKMLLYGLRLLP